ncbi:MAG: HAD-IIIA family hydrolase [Verrucomicrobia bacterium]|nr:HAD-IIIA family hydrolase [Verrucomicrobiota bacterium]MCF7707595.1 HAD-IIIA family hydrolase [Verrucomicrobiota bacterium]
MNFGVFIERDGVLNKQVMECGRPTSPRSLVEFSLNLEVAGSLKVLKDAGYIIIVTTNQPGISTGEIPKYQIERMHRLLLEVFPVDDLFLCPHEPMDVCPCRKPKPGMFFEAGFKWNLNLEHSFVVSRMWQDSEAAHLVGATSLLIDSPWNGCGHHDFILSDFAEVCERIMRLGPLKPRKRRQYHAISRV